MSTRPRTSPNKITKLRPNEIFVFGSNLAGIHGAGAAYTAYTKFGAQWGIGEGRTGQCYAIPTKNSNLVTLDLNKIEDAVRLFLKYASNYSELQFLVTPIGCGLAGYKPKDIAPFFKFKSDNVIVPLSFDNVNYPITT